MKTIDRQIAQGRQSINFTEVIEFDGHKLRISIKSDSYNFQSYARISRWNGEEWKQVHFIHFSEMKTPSGLCYQPNEKCDYKHFINDRDQLIKVAKEII